MPIRTFTVAQLEELDVNPWNCLANVEGERHRWYTVRHLVFEHEGRYFEVDYLSPASEDQESQPHWDMSTDDAPGTKITVTEVRKVPRVVEQWEPAPDESLATDDKGLSLTDLLGKIDWEGGLAGALDYGLKPRHMGAEARAQYPEVAACWDALCAAYEPYDELVTRWGRLVGPIEDAIYASQEEE